MADATFKVVRDKTDRDIVIKYRTNPGTAIAGRDYDPSSGSFIFEKGSAEKDIAIPVVTKGVNSLEREFYIDVSSDSTKVEFEKSRAVCKITADRDLTPLTYGTKKDMLFRPMYWSVDSQPTESCSIVSDNLSFTAYMTNRTKSGLAGVLWNTEDTFDHKGIGYTPHRNLSNAKFYFSMTVSSLMQDFSQPELTPTLTITQMDDTIHYVPLIKYSTRISSDFKTADILLDFANLKSGPDLEFDVDTTQIKQLLFSVAAADYEETVDVQPLPGGNRDLQMKISLLSLPGGEAWPEMTVNDQQIPAHDIRMSTSYDDMYNLTAERVMHNIRALGYRDMINHYNGMSHYYEFSWNGTRWALNKTKYLNKATEEWFKSYMRLCGQFGYEVINSVSFELMSTVCPPEWVQHDWYDSLAATGYEPPSYVLSPLIEEGMTYIMEVMDTFAKISIANNVVPQIQIGEPWWWYNTATNLPCIYDYPTKVAFNAKTGLFAQDIGTKDNYNTGTPYDEYVTFCREALGNRVVKFGTDLKLRHPTLKITLLPFLPSIIDNGLMEFLNLPYDSYASSNFDYYCTECYDWLIQGKMEKSFEAITIPKNDLHYTEPNIHYLAGFVPDEVLAPLYGFDPNSPYRPYLWKMIFGNIALNASKFPGIHQYIWAYPQIMHDSITTYGSSSDVFYMDGEALEAYLQDTPFEE